MKRLILIVVFILVAMIALGEETELPTDGMYQNIPNTTYINEVKYEARYVVFRIGLQRQLGLVHVAFDMDKNGEIVDSEVNTLEGMFDPTGVVFIDEESVSTFVFLIESSTYRMTSMTVEGIIRIDFKLVEPWL